MKLLLGCEQHATQPTRLRHRRTNEWTLVHLGAREALLGEACDGSSSRLRPSR
jgi:hypothetical protein